MDANKASEKAQGEAPRERRSLQIGRLHPCKLDPVPLRRVVIGLPTGDPIVIEFPPGMTVLWE